MHLSSFFSRSGFIGGLSLFLVACGGAPSGPSSPLPSTQQAPATSSSGLASQVASACNKYRSSKGKAALSRHAGLDRLALQHAQTMAKSGKINHSGLAKREGIASMQFGISRLVENVARGKSLSSKDRLSAIMNAWINSGVHRKNLLSTSSTHYGVGVAIGSDGFFNAVYISGRK